MNALTNIYVNLSTSIYGADIGIQFVDVDLGQLKKNGETIPIEYPAVIIRFENVAWKNDDSGIQKGLVHVRLKIIYSYEQEFYIAVLPYREEVTYFMDMVKAVHDAVMTIPPGNFTKLYRFNENHLETIPEEMKWVYCIDYQCNIWENGDDIDYAMHDTSYDLIGFENVFLERTIDAERVK